MKKLTCDYCGAEGAEAVTWKNSETHSECTGYLCAECELLERIALEQDENFREEDGDGEMVFPMPDNNPQKRH